VAGRGGACCRRSAGALVFPAIAFDATDGSRPQAGTGGQPREGTMTDAGRLFAEDGYYCAEAVVKATAMRLGLDDRLVTRLATGFGSGEGRTAGPCGALSGGILALSLALAPDDPRTDRERTYAAVQELRERFEETFGAVTCPGLLDGCHLGTPEGRKRFQAENMSVRCARYTAGAAEMVAQILDEGF